MVASLKNGATEASRLSDSAFRKSLTAVQVDSGKGGAGWLDDLSRS